VLLHKLVEELRAQGLKTAPSSGSPLAWDADGLARRISIGRLEARLGLLACRAPHPLPLRQLIPDHLTLPCQSPSGHARVPLVAIGDSVAIGDPLLLADADSLEVDLFSPVRATVMSLDLEEGLRLQVR
jgi:hypothetical protein